MLKFITNLFGVKKEPAPVAPTPYKVEEPVAEIVAEIVAPATVVKSVPKAKKPVVKKASTRKPRTSKTPKA